MKNGLSLWTSCLPQILEERCFPFSLLLSCGCFMGKKKKKKKFNMLFGRPFSHLLLPLPPGGLCFFEFLFKKKKNTTFKCFFSPDSFSPVHIPFSNSHWFYPGAFILHIKGKVLKPGFPYKIPPNFSDLFFGNLLLNFASTMFAPRQFSFTGRTVTSEPPSLWTCIQRNFKDFILQLNRSAFPVHFYKTTGLLPQNNSRLWLMWILA